MSGRCKSCNAVLTEDEMCAKWPGSDDFCELCSYCLVKSDPDAEWSDDPFDELDDDLDE